MNRRKIYTIILSTLSVLILGIIVWHVSSTSTKKTQAEAQQQVIKKKQTKKKLREKAPSPLNVKDDKHMVNLKDFKYNSASEKKKYPDLYKYPKAWIDVDITTQRVYIKDGKTNLYEMYSSTGKHDTTPRGTYHIQNERGDFFYTAPLKLGAYYYVSFLNHGEYLFHTTPTDEQGTYVKSIAKTLGREPSSHGCVHLSVPDCKWIYENVPSGMKVVIHGKYQTQKA